MIPVLILPGACRTGEAPEREAAPVETDAEAEAETEAEAEVDAVEVAPFAPPADGKLTAEQVEMYIAVRKELAFAETPSGEPATLDLKSLSPLVDAGGDTAEALGFDRDEYSWVAARVAEARPLPFRDALADVARSITEASLQSLEKQRARTDDPDAIARLDEDIARLKTTQAEQVDSSERPKGEAQVFNEELVAKYDEELRALESATRVTLSQDSSP